MRIVTLAIGLSVLAAGIGATTTLQAAPGDEHWDQQFGWPGPPTGAVIAMVATNGQLYVAGGGEIADQSAQATVHHWDGRRWVGFTPVMVGVNLFFTSLALHHGELYVGGQGFTSAGGVPMEGIARWNGTGWSPIGSINGTVLSLVSHSNQLYAAGSFTSAGGVSATNVARWDGSNWYPLGDGLGFHDTNNYPVRRLHVFDNQLLAGGSFTNSGNTPVRGVARFSGTAWVPYDGTIAGDVLGFGSTAGVLYAGGLFTNVDGIIATNVARWEAGTWSPLPGAPGDVYDLHIAGTNVYIATLFISPQGERQHRVSRWSGAGWATLGGDFDDLVYDLTSEGDKLYAGGNFSAASGRLVGGVAWWDGSEWQPIGPGASVSSGNAVESMAYDGSNSFYFGGSFLGARGVASRAIVRWDRTNWYGLDSGLSGLPGVITRARAIALNGPDVYVGGAFSNAGPVAARNIARWNGSTWNALGSGLSGPVTSLVTNGPLIYAGGSFTNAGGVTAARVAVWNGSTWSALGSGMNNTVSVLIHVGGVIYAGGTFTNAGGMTANRIARWNGSAWSPLIADGTNGVNGTVSSLFHDGGLLYVGGSFTTAGGRPFNRIAVWDGVSWSALGTGMGSGSVLAITKVGGTLYAGGSFNSAGGNPILDIARWDGFAWQALGSGLTPPGYSGSVSELMTVNDDLYLGGSFQVAGGRSSYQLARWNENQNLNPPAELETVATGIGITGRPQFRTIAVSITNYVIEAATNLMTWSPIATNSVSPYYFEETNITTHRFYRARGL